MRFIAQPYFIYNKQFLCVFVMLVVSQSCTSAPGEAHCDPEAPPGGWCKPQHPRPADGSRHTTASHSRAGASARRAQEQPLPSYPPQHQIKPQL